MLTKSFLLLIGVSLLLSACRLDITVPQGGQVESLSGSYRCGSGQTCSIEVDDDEFDETFRAIPDQGYEFVGWQRAERSFCGGQNKDCRLNTTDFDQYPELQPFLSSDEVFYLRPVFDDGARYPVGGKIRALSSSFADGDVNDDFALYTPNDFLDQAQAVPNPVTIGGYANELGAGEPGLSTDFGDRDDYFELDLVAGEVISLVVADADRGDLDLYLVDADGFIVDGSLETGSYEQLRVAQSGHYYLNVYAYSGASNYTLAVGLQGPSGQRSGMTLGNRFELDRAIVDYQPAPISASAAVVEDTGPELVSLMPAQPLSVTQSAPTPTGQQWVFRDGVTEDKWRTLMQIKSLRRGGGVRHADPNFIYELQAVNPSDELYPLQAHLQQINLPQAWEISRGDSGVVVAVLDTGLLFEHPDLRGRALAGYDFISNPDRSFDGDGIDPDAQDPGGDEPSGPSVFHGSHVAGTIASSSNNDRGIAGIDWRARIMPVRVISGAGGTAYDTIQGIRYAAGLSNDSGTLPAQRADVINMSIGCVNCYVQAEQDAVLAARRKGVIVVAAAGNKGHSIPSHPAAYEGVISVGAVGPNNSLAPYSNFGSSLDIVAPGGDISLDTDGNGFGDGVLSTIGEDAQGGVRYTYQFYQGTSMASPHVAGVIALMKAVNPGLRPGDVDQMLRQGRLTVDLGGAGRDDRYGHGLLDAYKALRAARDFSDPGSEPQQLLSITPSQLSLTQGPQKLSITDSGTGASATVAVEPGASWVKITPLGVNDFGLGRYRVAAKLGDRAPGVYESVVRVRYGGESHTVPVFAQKTEQSFSGTVG